MLAAPAAPRRPRQSLRRLLLRQLGLAASTGNAFPIRPEPTAASALASRCVAQADLRLSAQERG